MKGARLGLVPVDDVPCAWCGVRFGHDARCYVGRLPAPPPPPSLSSLESFRHAQRDGTTVGHEWATKKGPA